MIFAWRSPEELLQRCVGSLTFLPKFPWLQTLGPLWPCQPEQINHRLQWQWEDSGRVFIMQYKARKNYDLTLDDTYIIHVCGSRWVSLLICMKTLQMWLTIAGFFEETCCCDNHQDPRRVSVVMRRSAMRPLEGGQTLTHGQSCNPNSPHTQMGNIPGQIASGQDCSLQ